MKNYQVLQKLLRELLLVPELEFYLLLNPVKKREKILLRQLKKVLNM